MKVQSGKVIFLTLFFSCYAAEKEGLQEGKSAISQIVPRLERRSQELRVTGSLGSVSVENLLELVSDIKLEREHSATKLYDELEAVALKMVYRRTQCQLAYE